MEIILIAKFHETITGFLDLRNFGANRLIEKEDIIFRKISTTNFQLGENI